MATWRDPVTFAEVWLRAVASRADQTFLIFEGPGGHVAEWTYSEFDQQVARVGATLREHGVEPGNAVHLALANSPTFVAVWLAAARLGAWIVPSDPMGRTPELHGHIERTKPVVGICAAARADVYRAAAGHLPVIEVDEADVDLVPFGEIELGDWPVPSLHDRAAVMFTSGTTGLPKGVEVTQANYAFAGKVMAEAARLEPPHRQLVVLPLFHANAQYYSFASAIWRGASVALMHTFSASGFIEQARRHAATHASLFAAPMRMILARGLTDTAAPLTLEHCWYAQNISDEQHATLTRAFGCKPRQLYGMTETIPAVLTDDVQHPVPSSMGFVTPGCEVELHDAGRNVAPGEVGEIVHRSPHATLGYHQDEEKTREAFRHGWFHSGDLGYVDETGHLYVVDRKKDMIKTGGENVASREVEEAIYQLDGVAEVAVFGVSHPRWVEAVAAAVVPKVGAALTPEAVIEHARSVLAGYKTPKYVVIVEALPKNPSGKIVKRQLREQHADLAAPQ